MTNSRRTEMVAGERTTEDLAELVAEQTLERGEIQGEFGELYDEHEKQAEGTAES
jgi:uncharacterized protein YjbJ (UPF0337 family)